MPYIHAVRRLLAAAQLGGSCLLPGAGPTVPVTPIAARSPDPGCEAASYAPSFAAGEELRYSVKFGPLKAGEGSIEVLGRDTVRGREAWHVRFRVRGGVPMYRVDDALESWIDTGCFQSLRFVQRLDERGRKRERRFEIFPERTTFSENDGAEQPSVATPLDDASFFFFVRTRERLVEGESYEFPQYFRPDRNPVVLRVVGRERVTVPAGTFDAVVLQPAIKTKGLFSDKGDARIWLTDDRDRLLVKMTAKLSVGTLSLSLTSYRPGCDPAGAWGA